MEPGRPNPVVKDSLLLLPSDEPLLMDLLNEVLLKDLLMDFVAASLLELSLPWSFEGSSSPSWRSS